jgi:hypothetical protein
MTPTKEKEISNMINGGETADRWLITACVLERRRSDCRQGHDQPGQLSNRTGQGQQKIQG